MKAIFLDIDGVLNSTRYYLTDDSFDARPYPLNEIDPKAVERLNRLIDQTGAKIVISSSWRIRPEFKELYKCFGIQSPLYGETPCIFGRRGKEITEYLKDHPEIDNYVILDDYDFPDSDLEKSPLKDHFIRTIYDTGLMDEDVDDAIKILNRTN